MFRLLGFIIGSAASIGAMLWLLGVPRLHLSDPELDQGRFAEAVERLREKQRDAAAAPVPGARANHDDEGGTTTLASEDIGQPTQPPDTTETAAAVEPAVPAAAIQQGAGSAALEQELHWHSFWNPFHSEIAARGFVSRLEQVTGLDYRVVKVRSGVYEVAFAYANDGERQSKLEQIHAATGLDLPGT